MQLTTLYSNNYLQVSITSSTVIEPGEKTTIKILLSAIQDCTVSAMHFEVENARAEVTINEELAALFPIELNRSNPTELEIPILTKPKIESFGIIRGTFEIFQLNTKLPSIETDTWISIFLPAIAAVEGLDLALRLRLMDVVNYRVRNGHIFLADYALFFKDFLNITIPDKIIALLSEEFGLPIEGLPVDEEIRYLVIIGTYTFYGIEQLELITEEDCNESDDKFDSDAMREVKPEEV